MKNKRARDSVNGRFIPLEEARKRPRETTVETVKSPNAGKMRDKPAMADPLQGGCLVSAITFTGFQHE
ncbi:hypothetical protein [Pseudomonas viridiflava]|uniref:Competence/damage inducible protein CinA n=1 Tax=Pseudomonas viridiflava TaxID=33069 RepID=A0A3M4PP05_PSEVI|nr:hypothetical protein AO068_00240 [Pseudomonas sp. ICMP 3272]KTC55053.1 hypothetical protein AO258_00245 [Pseudomonas syringae ICMP 19498]RMQ79634.1 Competence/damage inducible protein CinA [Pseudomonas viridiflava]